MSIGKRKISLCIKLGYILLSMVQICSNTEFLLFNKYCKYFLSSKFLKGQCLQFMKVVWVYHVKMGYHFEKGCRKVTWKYLVCMETIILSIHVYFVTLLIFDTVNFDCPYNIVLVCYIQS